MSYKNALAGLPFGGGKAVLNRPMRPFDREAIFRIFAEAVAKLGGRYVTAEDVGTSVSDMMVVRAHTTHVAGLERTLGMAGGDPSPWTALGIFEAMAEAVRMRFETDLKGMRVAIQGVGNVGAGLAALLHEAGARLIVADVDRDRATVLADRYGADLADPSEILTTDCEIFAPCALGGVLTKDNVPSIKARIVCGGANNQLAPPAAGLTLADCAIVYCPDYLVNAGGIINVAAEYLGETTEQVAERVQLIPGRLREVLGLAAVTGRTPHVVADEMAEQIIASGRVIA